MRTVVLVKQVPDTDNVKLDPDTGTMVREGLDVVVNLFDLYGLEVALKLKEDLGGEVIALSMGPPNTEYVLRESLALGADEAYLLTDRAFAGADTLATSVVLASAIENLIGEFDLVIAGEKATDGETGQVGPEVAVILGIPAITYVSRIVECDGRHIVVERDVEDGVETWKVELPALLSVTRSVSEPRLPTLKGMKSALKKEIPRYGLEDLNLDPESVGLRGSPTRVVKVFNVKVARNGEIFEGERLEDGIERVVSILRRFVR